MEKELILQFNIHGDRSLEAGGRDEPEALSLACKVQSIPSAHFENKRYKRKSNSDHPPVGHAFIWSESAD